MRLLAWVVAIAAACGVVDARPAAAPLVLEATISLPRVAGRIDHLAIDLARKHLFIAELGNGTVDVVDLATRNVLHRIEGLDEPQGVAYLPARDLLIVACGGDGTVRSYSGADFKPGAMIDLGDDADNVRIDPRDATILVGHGGGGIATIDPVTFRRIADVALPAHPEGFQLSPRTSRIFVNVPDAGQIDVIDSSKHALAAAWKTPGLSSNFPVALDDQNHTLDVAFRAPPRLVQFDAQSGTRKALAETCADADDVFVDAKYRRIYVSCGAGFLDVFDAASLRRIASVPTAAGGRTSLFVPELERLFVAVRAGWFGSDASLRVYRPAP